MNVYVLFYNQPGYVPDIMGVFSTRELAEEGARKLCNADDDHYRTFYMEIIETPINHNRMLINDRG